MFNNDRHTAKSLNLKQIFDPNYIGFQMWWEWSVQGSNVYTKSNFKADQTGPNIPLLKCSPIYKLHVGDYFLKKLFLS